MIITLAIIGFIALLAIYMGFIRNYQVYKLRDKVLQEEGNWLHAHPDHLTQCRYPYHFRYKALPSYDRMLYSFWTRVSTFEKRLKPVEEYHKHEAQRRVDEQYTEVYGT